MHHLNVQSKKCWVSRASGPWTPRPGIRGREAAQWALRAGSFPSNDGARRHPVAFRRDTEELMRARVSVSIFLGLVLASLPAFASFSGSSKPEQNANANTTRQEAERLYGDAYNDVAKAKKDLADGKTKNLEKKFKKALERGERAVELDSTYHEAWNLVGYCARNLKLYDKSLAAYQRALTIKPDFAAAREYLGETYLEMGQPDKAREQLAWLEKLSAA